MESCAIVSGCGALPCIVLSPPSPVRACTTVIVLPQAKPHRRSLSDGPNSRELRCRAQK